MQVWNWCLQCELCLARIIDGLRGEAGDGGGTLHPGLGIQLIRAAPVLPLNFKEMELQTYGNKLHGTPFSSCWKKGHSLFT